MMKTELHDDLAGVAQLGVSQVTEYISVNNIDVTDDELADVIETVYIKGSVGKLFRHNGGRSQPVGDEFIPIAFPVIIREDNEYTYDDATHSITISKSGWHHVQSQISVGSKLSSAEVAIFINGNMQKESLGYINQQSDSGTQSTITIQWLLNTVSGDVVDIRIKRISPQTTKLVTMTSNITITRN